MGKLLSNSIDWLTVTSSDALVQTKMGRVWHDVFSLALDQGGIIASSRWLGYDGHIINGQFYGERPDGYIMKLTGAYAARYSQRVLQTGAHCTRIDFQATEQLESYDALYGEKLRQEAFVNRAILDNRNWAKLKRRDENGDGDTITTGARSSDKYGRIYDKEKESNDDAYARCWRWEVEYKGPAAVHYAAALRDCSDVAGYCRSVVYNQYSEWGFCPSFKGDTAANLFVPLIVASDVAKTLQWICIQVAPSVAKLLDNNVKKETLLAILGLD